MEHKFVVFISYSRKDKEVAEWLHKQLESYVIPDREKSSTIFPFKGKHFRPVFIDLQDLHMEERPFSERLQTAIKESAFLVVLCSRHSAVSPFVNKEIEYFMETHDNNMARIVPLFIDEVDGCIPKAFNGTSIMQRHFPIFNTHLKNSSEANKYCLYQLLSYILKLNFSDIYNRYEVAQKRALEKRRNIFTVITALLLAISGILAYSFYQYKVASDRAIEIEKTVFPQAVVHGYERNFITPVINYLKEQDESFVIYVLMPKSKRELMHQDRVGDFVYEAKRQLQIDSIPIVLLPTESKRGSRIMRIAKDGEYIDGVYLDFATTTTSFLDIAKYKRKYKEYRRTPIDTIISEYAYEFASQTKDKLESDSVFVQFVFDKNQLIKILKNNILTSK